MAAGRYINHKVDTGEHEEATGGWDYYDVLYHVDGLWFTGINNIMLTDEGPRFYDITQLKNIDPPEWAS